MRAIQFLVIFSLTFNLPFAFAAEVSSGGSVGGKRTPALDNSAGVKSPVKTVPDDSRVKQGTCPLPLKESALADTDKENISFKFNSQDRKCTDAVSAYQTSLNGKNSAFESPQALGSHLQKQFSDIISPNLEKSLSACTFSLELTPAQGKIVQTRVYAAAARIENFNKSAMEEIAFIDSITPGAKVLNDVECAELLPDLKKRCQDLAFRASGCAADSSKRLDDQVDRTVNAIKEIENLKIVQANCNKGLAAGNLTKKSCDDIGKAIEVIKDEVPWIRGQTFDSIARKSTNRSSVKQYLGRDKIKEAMTEQLKENREALAKAYSDNLGNFRCLFNNSDQGQKCDLAKVNSEIAKLEDPKIPESKNNKTNAEIQNSFEAESCLLNRTSSASSADSSRASTGLVSLTGTDSLSLGAKTLNSLSKTAIANRRGHFASKSSIEELLGQVGNQRKNGYEACTKDSFNTLNKLSKADKQNNLVCGRSDSAANQAGSVNRSCLVGTLLNDTAILGYTDGRLPAAVSMRSSIQGGRGLGDAAVAAAAALSRRRVSSVVAPAPIAPKIEVAGDVAPSTSVTYPASKPATGIDLPADQQQKLGFFTADRNANQPEVKPIEVTPAPSAAAISPSVQARLDSGGKLIRDSTGGAFVEDVRGVLTKVIVPSSNNKRVVTTGDSSSGNSSFSSAASQQGNTNTNAQNQAQSTAQSTAQGSQGAALSLQINSGSGGGGNAGGVVASRGGSSSVRNVTRSSGRSPASVSSSYQPAPQRSAEDDLVAALSASPNTSARSANIGGGSSVSGFSGVSGKVSVKSTGSKAEEVSDGIIDKTTNARFTEGEQIRVPKFEQDKDADFTVVKKLDNGLLRVKDIANKEFNLLRDEVKRAIRLSLNGAPDPLLNVKPALTPAKIGGNLAPGELVNSPKKIEDVKLKDEFVRPGDKVTVSNFDGGTTLKASVVYKNPDGSVRVLDESGKEFDLAKTDAKRAKFSRELTDEVRQNLEIPDEAERIAAAQNYVGRPLTADQEAAIIKSHKIAEDKGIYSISKAEINEKTKVLREVGFSEDEANLLFRKGVTSGSGIDTVSLVAEQEPIPQFDIVKGKQIQIPVAGSTSPGAVMSGPDKDGSYEVEYYQKDTGISRARKTARELLEANVNVPEKVSNPIINVPLVGKDISYPGKVVSGPNSKGQYNVEIYPPGEPVSVVTVNELDLKRANTSLALREAKIRAERHATFERISSAELAQIVSDSLRESEKAKNKKIDIDGQKALEELAKRQNRKVSELQAEMKLARKAKPSLDMNSSDIYNSPQASGARSEIAYLAEQDGLGGKLTEQQQERIARDLGIDDGSYVTAIDYGVIASRKETRNLFERILPGNKTFDGEMLRRTMSYNPEGGFVGPQEFLNAEKFVEAFRNADVNSLTLSERRLLNKYTDRAPLYARQGNLNVPLIARQTLQVGRRSMASAGEAGPPRAMVEDADKTANEALSRLDELAEQDGLQRFRLTERQRETVARELGIYDQKRTQSMDYNAVARKAEVKVLFDKLFPGKKQFDIDLLRQTLSYNPRGGFVTEREYLNAEKFTNVVLKANIDGSNLSLSERRLLNRFTNRAPLYARQIAPETPIINPHSLEAVVPPLITQNKVSTFAARGDEIVAQALVKQAMARAGDKVHLQNFEGGADLHAYFIRANKDGTVRIKDARGKEFNLGAQAIAEAKFYRGLTAELKANGDLDIPSRQKAAEGYVKRSLTQAQKDAVTNAYEVGGKERGFFDYTSDELRQKTSILRKAGFTMAEATLLLRKGVTGNSPAELSKVIKVDPNEVRVGDRVTIEEFNGTGELRGEIIGPAKNGGLILREENGSETILYKPDLEDVATTRITRDPHRRTIASEDDGISLQRTPVNMANAVRRSVPVEISGIRSGDRIVINEFNGHGHLEGYVTSLTKNGGYTVRSADGSETVVYKTDLEDTKNAKVLREWGVKPPVAKNKITEQIDFSADSPLLVAKDYKNNPDIIVPVGNGEVRQGRVISKVDPRPGFVKTFVVEYADEAGVINHLNLTQDQLLAAANPEALKKIKEDLARSSEYQAKNDADLRQILDEGHRAAKDALGKGRTVDKQDLNAESQMALSELARRNKVTSRAVFESYKRGGIKGVESIASNTLAKNNSRAPASIPAADINFSKIKTGDFVITAGIGDNIKLPKSDKEGFILGRENVNGEVIYSVGVTKPDKTVSIQKVTEREVGESNPQFVGLKEERFRNHFTDAVRAQIEKDFNGEEDVDVLATVDGPVTTTSTKKAKVRTTMSDSFAALLIAVATNRNEFGLAQVDAFVEKFSANKQEAISQAKTGKVGSPSNALRADVENLQLSLERRQTVINNTRVSLEQIDDSLASMVAKDVGRSGNANFTTWEITLNNASGKPTPTKLNFSAPVNMSRSEAMAQIREFSSEVRIDLLNAQGRLDFDKAYLAELRTKVGVPKRAQPLNGGSLFVEALATSRNPASETVKVPVKAVNVQTKNLIEDLDSVIATRARSYGLRDVSEITSAHPLTPVIEKQRQIIGRLNRVDRQFQPEVFSKLTSNVANDFVKTGDIDLAMVYYRASADTIFDGLGAAAKSFWSSEANGKMAIKVGFVSDNIEVAHLAIDKFMAAKTKSSGQEEKKVALDYYHNLNYEHGRILEGVKRFGNPYKELDLLVIRKQQQYLSEKYKLKDGIESVSGKDSWQKMEDQAQITVDELLKNPKLITDPDKFKMRPRIPAASEPSAVTAPEQNL
jgi:hypothetical protein